MTKSSVQNAELPQKFNLWPAASPGIKENIVIGKNIQNTEKPRKKGGCRVTAFTVPGMYYEKVYLILTGLHSVIEPHFAGFFHAFSLSQIVDVYKEVVSKLCQKALYPVEDRVLYVLFVP